MTVDCALHIVLLKPTTDRHEAYGAELGYLFHTTLHSTHQL